MIKQSQLLTKVLLLSAIFLVFGLSSCAQTNEEKYLTGVWDVYYYDYASDLSKNFGGQVSLKDGEYEFIPAENISRSRLDALGDHLLFIQTLIVSFY